jgi:hypothetical protein
VVRSPGADASSDKAGCDHPCSSNASVKPCSACPSRLRGRLRRQRSMMTSQRPSGSRRGGRAISETRKIASIPVADVVGYPGSRERTRNPDDAKARAVSTQGMDSRSFPRGCGIAARPATSPRRSLLPMLSKRAMPSSRPPQAGRARLDGAEARGFRRQRTGPIAISIEVFFTSLATTPCRLEWVDGWPFASDLESNRR